MIIIEFLRAQRAAMLTLLENVDKTHPSDPYATSTLRQKLKEVDAEIEKLTPLQTPVVCLGVVGSRDWPDKGFVSRTLDAMLLEHPTITTIVSGGQPKGVDGWAEEYSKEKGLEMLTHLPAHSLPMKDPEYEPYHPSNFFVRNTSIVESSDLILAFCFEESGGTLDTYNKALRMGVPAILYSTSHKGILSK